MSDRTGIGNELVQDLERIAKAIDILGIHLDAFFVISGDPTAKRPGGVIKVEGDVVSRKIRDLERDLDYEEEKDN